MGITAIMETTGTIVTTAIIRMMEQALRFRQNQAPALKPMGLLLMMELDPRN